MRVFECSCACLSAGRAKRSRALGCARVRALSPALGCKCGQSLRLQVWTELTPVTGAAQVDIYSFGVLLWELSAGEAPPGRSLRPLRYAPSPAPPPAAPGAPAGLIDRDAALSKPRLFICRWRKRV